MGEKKSFCIKSDTALSNEFRQEAMRKGLTHEALFRMIWFFWKEKAQTVAELEQDLLSGRKRIVESNK